VLRVIVNGTDLGILWVPDTRVDVTDHLRRGKNRLELIVANTWRNRLVGDRDKPQDQRSTWLLANRLGSGPVPSIAPTAQLLPAGLLGPVRLVPSVRKVLGRVVAG
jgi:hypothetical protein